MSIHQFNEISIRQFIDSSIKRLSPPALISLVVSALVAGCGGPAAPLPPSASTPPSALPSATVPGQDAAGVVVAPRLGRAYVLDGPRPGHPGALHRRSGRLVRANAGRR